MSSEDNYEKPRWLRDLLRFLPLKSQFILSDNVRDLQVQEMGSGMVAPLPMLQFLARELREFGYAHVVFYDPVKGFRVNTLPGEDTSKSDGLFKDFGLQPTQGCAPAGIDLFSETLGRILDRLGEPIAVLADFASRMVVRNDSLSLPEHLAFTRALVHSHSARPRPYGTPGRPFFNTVIWVVEKEGDLPDWFLVGNPRVRHIPIAKPDHNLRRVFGASLLRSLEGYREAGPQSIKDALDAFVEQTEGLLLLDLAAIVELGRTEKLGITKIADAVRRYKVGVTEDPWVRIDRDKIRRAGEFVHRRVKGQDQAVTHVLDIVKRAVTGIGTQRRGSRPRAHGRG
jgi:hypothetical protein